MCHNEVYYISLWAFTPALVCAEPLIHKVRIRSERDIRQGSDKVKQIRGDMMIRGLWDQQAESIIDVKLGTADTDSYQYDPMAALLTWWETINKYNHGKHCHERKRFLSFVISVDGMLGKEALVILAQLSQTMAAKMNKPILHVRGWING